MAELYQELKDADYEAELNMLAYEEWVMAEIEKEVDETYQLNKTEQNALNTYMEGSNAFYNINGAVLSSSDVLKLHNRKKRRRKMSSSLQSKDQSQGKKEATDHGHKSRGSEGHA